MRGGDGGRRRRPLGGGRSTTCAGSSRRGRPPRAAPASVHVDRPAVAVGERARVAHLLDDARRVTIGGVGPVDPPAGARVVAVVVDDQRARCRAWCSRSGNSSGPSSAIDSARASTPPISNVVGASRAVESAPPRDVYAATPHVARKISAMTAMPPSTGTTARASGERSRGGVTGEPGTVPPGRSRRGRRHAVHSGRGLVPVLGHARRVLGAPSPVTRPERGSRLSTKRRRPRAWICSSTRASSTSPATASRSARAVSPSTVDEAVAQADKAGYPVVVKAQVQVGGRGKAGGIKLANDADEVRTHAGNILGMDIKGHTVERGLGGERLRHRGGVLRQLHARPGRQAAPADALGPGRRRDRGGRREGPRRHRQAAHRSRRRPLRGDGPPGRRRRQDPRAGARRRRRDPRPALRVLHQGRLRPGRDQPVDPQADG